MLSLVQLLVRRGVIRRNQRDFSGRVAAQYACSRDILFALFEQAKAAECRAVDPGPPPSVQSDRTRRIKDGKKTRRFPAEFDVVVSISRVDKADPVTVPAVSQFFGKNRESANLEFFYLYFLFQITI